MVGAVLPVDWVKMTPPAPIVAEYLTESAKYASSAVTKLRRSDFIEARYAFSFVLANFGIAIAARMPMITTTISSSMSVKPLRFICTSPFGVPVTAILRNSVEPFYRCPIQASRVPWSVTVGATVCPKRSWDAGAPGVQPDERFVVDGEHRPWRQGVEPRKQLREVGGDLMRRSSPPAAGEAAHLDHAVTRHHHRGEHQHREAQPEALPHHRP